jgi:lysine decarboxylase
VLSALVLTGLEPIWLTPEIDAKTGVPMGIPVSELEKTLDQKPIALLLTEPSYLGTLSELEALISKAHSRDIPVIVDAAWGAHFGFNSDLPQHALQMGADALITSVHKTLPGYSASALLLAQGKLLNLDRIEQSFETTHTTSPAGAPLASIDGCRALLQTRGEELTGNLIDLVDSFKDKVEKACGTPVFLNAFDFPTGRFDPAKIVLRANLLGVSGVEVESELEKQKIRVEMADQDTIVFLATLADSSDDFDEVASKLIPILEKLRTNPRQTQTALSWSIVPKVGMSIRDAYFAETEFIKAADAVGRVSADLIAPYPPGVAVVAPGEELTKQIVDGLAASKKAGVRIAYASDPTLQTYRVTKRV